MYSRFEVFGNILLTTSLLFKDTLKKDW